MREGEVAGFEAFARLPRRSTQLRRWSATTSPAGWPAYEKNWGCTPVLDLEDQLRRYGEALEHDLFDDAYTNLRSTAATRRPWRRTLSVAAVVAVLVGGTAAILVHTTRDVDPHLGRRPHRLRFRHPATSSDRRNHGVRINQLRPRGPQARPGSARRSARQGPVDLTDSYLSIVPTRPLYITSIIGTFHVMSWYSAVRRFVAS